MRTQWSFAIVRNHCGLNLLKTVESSLIGVKYVMVSRNVKMPSDAIALRYVLTQQNVQATAYVMFLQYVLASRNVKMPSNVIAQRYVLTQQNVQVVAYVMVLKNVQHPISVQVVRFTAPSLSPHANQ